MECILLPAHQIQRVHTIKNALQAFPRTHLLYNNTSPHNKFLSKVMEASALNSSSSKTAHLRLRHSSLIASGRGVLGDHAQAHVEAQRYARTTSKLPRVQKESAAILHTAKHKNDLANLVPVDKNSSNNRRKNRRPKNFVSQWHQKSATGGVCRTASQTASGTSQFSACIIPKPRCSRSAPARCPRKRQAVGRREPQFQTRGAAWFALRFRQLATCILPANRDPSKSVFVSSSPCLQ